MISEPAFPDDDGRADPDVSRALMAYAAGRGGEHTVLSALRESRLLVPVVAVLNEADSSEMALPTLTGDDGRRAVLAFTSVDTLAQWRPDARPVPVHARQAGEAARGEGADALVIDVAGPVQFVIDGPRLAALAEGRPAPMPYEDPDILAVIETVTGAESGVSRVQIGPGTTAELAVRIAVHQGEDERAVLQRVADRLAERLRGRIVGGVELGIVRR